LLILASAPHLGCHSAIAAASKISSLLRSSIWEIFSLNSGKLFSKIEIFN
jgi:hypothetical protein